MKKIFPVYVFIAFFSVQLRAQESNKIIVRINENNVHQTIQNFGASDAWSGQFVGNWPATKKNAIADWLFSTDTLLNGNPKGIGLSLWRYNLGAGSAEQQDNSGIKDEWRRAALTINNNKKVQAQNWLLKAAKERGVKQFLAFYNSPPVSLTKNKRAFADSGLCNISSNNYIAFADYTVTALNQIHQQTGVSFNYISPVNEPQWDWSDGGQEGCPYTNAEIAGVVKAFSKSFQQHKLNTEILITESGNLNYLLTANDKHDKDAQVYDFFNPLSSLYIGNLSNITKTIAAHSYFATSPFDKAVALRTKVKDSIAAIKGLAYWQSEYCILGDNAGEINGDKRDTGITSALYLAKVIYEDLVAGNAAAWQWWIAISPYNYKDGLVYIDKGEAEGNYYDSKMLWAFGNYSRFIRPGMQRIDIAIDSKDVLASAYTDALKHKLVLVFVNESDNEKPIALNSTANKSNKKTITYTTSATQRLEKRITDVNHLIIPAKSIVTVVW